MDIKSQLRALIEGRGMAGFFKDLADLLDDDDTLQDIMDGTQNNEGLYDFDFDSVVEALREASDELP